MLENEKRATIGESIKEPFSNLNNNKYLFQKQKPVANVEYVKKKGGGKEK
jgi:hypothetical protein